MHATGIKNIKNPSVSYHLNTYQTICYRCSTYICRSMLMLYPKMPLVLTRKKNILNLYHLNKYPSCALIYSEHVNIERHKHTTTKTSRTSITVSYSYVSKIGKNIDTNDTQPMDERRVLLNINKISQWRRNKNQRYNHCINNLNIKTFKFK